MSVARGDGALGISLEPDANCGAQDTRSAPYEGQRTGRVKRLFCDS